MKSPQTAEVLVSKVANALIESAELSPAVNAITHSGAFAWALGGFKKYYGGLWVGGRATLTNSKLSFEANAMNRLVQTRVLSVVDSLEQIKGHVGERIFHQHHCC